MTDRDLRCEKCGAPLVGGAAVVWLELDQRTGLYVDPDVIDVPPDVSQGCFPFGRACARRELAESDNPH